MDDIFFFCFFLPFIEQIESMFVYFLVKSELKSKIYKILKYYLKCEFIVNYWPLRSMTFTVKVQVCRHLL